MIDNSKEKPQRVEKGRVELSLGGVTEYSSDRIDVEVLLAYYYIHSRRKIGWLMDQTDVTVIFISTFHKKQNPSSGLVLYQHKYDGGLSPEHATSRYVHFIAGIITLVPLYFGNLVKKT